MLRLTVTGNLGRDAEVKQINQNFVINFSVAHTTKYRDQQGVQQSRTTWINCAYWTDRQPAVAQYLTKGTQVLVEGEPEVEWFNTKQNGIVASQKCRVRTIELLGSPKTDPNQGYQQQPQQPGHVSTGTGTGQEPPDDLPF